MASEGVQCESLVSREVLFHTKSSSKRSDQDEDGGVFTSTIDGRVRFQERVEFSEELTSRIRILIVMKDHYQ